MQKIVAIALATVALGAITLQSGLSAEIGVKSSADNGQNAGNREIVLDNNGFEQNFKGWRPRGGMTTGIYRIGTHAESFAGEHCAVLTVKADTGPKFKAVAYLSRDDLPIEAGSYRLSFALRTDLQAGQAGVRVVTRTAASRLARPVESKAEVPSATGKTAWKQYSFTYDLPEIAQTTALQLQLTDASGSAAFDDVRLTRLTTAPATSTMKETTAQADAGARQPQFPLKTARTIYNAAEIAQARANLEKYPAARKVAATIREAADYWMNWPDDKLRDLATAAAVPRASNLSEPGCPIHGAAIFEKAGTYPWIVDPKVPFKVKCPIGGEVYPSNDYETYYKSGFKEKKGWDTKYVDDGWGWVNPANGKRYWFVAYANEWTWYSAGVMTKDIGSKSVGTAVRDLAQAYFLTGDKRYAHKAAVLLYRIAEVYPAMDFSTQSDYGRLMAARGMRYRGKIVSRIWETALTAVFAEAYDEVWDTVDSDTALQKSTSKSGEQIRAFIEANILEEAIDSYFAGDIQGNFGTHQSTLAYLALVRQHGDNKKYFESLLSATGKALPYTGLNYALYNFAFRDGIPQESPGYNQLWIRKISDMARLLKKADIDLYKLPKMRGLYDSFLDMLNVGRFTPSLGDTGGVYGTVKGQDDVYRQAYEVYGDVRYAQWLAGFGAAGEGGFQTFESLFDPPVPVKSPVPPGRLLPPQPSRLLAGYGLGILNDPADDAGVTLAYGHKGSHFHYDRLNIDLFALGHPMTPDLGYPDGVNVRAKGTFAWTKNTIAHNTVVVDTAKQPANPLGTVHVFANGPFARVIDVDANDTCPQCPVYRRNFIMVDAGAGHNYFVDTFTVSGGRQHDYSLHGPPGPFETIGGQWSAPAKGTLAGENVKWGEIYDDPALLAQGDKASYPDYKGSGFQYLFNVQKQTGGSSLLQYRHLQDPQAQLRIRVLDQPGQQLLIADARVSPVRNKELIKYIIARRQAAPGDKTLTSHFVSVLEPYRGQPFITAVEQVPLDGGEGMALVVKRAGGQTDVILHDPSGSRKSLKRYALETDAQTAVVTLDAQNQVQRAFVAAGHSLTIHGKAYDIPAPLTGKVIAVDPAARTVRVKLDTVPAASAIAALAGRVVEFRNTLRQTVHPIENVSLVGDELLLKTRDELLVGRAYLTGVEADVLSTNTILPLAPIYKGTSLADANFQSFQDVRQVEDGKIQLARPLAANAPFKTGQDAWLVDVGLSDRLEVTPVYSWQRK